MKQILLKCIIPIVASLVLISVMLLYMLRECRKNNKQVASVANTLASLEYILVSYQEICQGTNNFSKSNLHGTGGLGCVYKGILSDGIIVAVKVLSKF